MDNIRVGVFVDRDSGGGVRDEDDDRPIVDLDLIENALDVRGDLNHLVAVLGLDDEFLHDGLFEIATIELAFDDRRQ